VGTRTNCGRPPAFLPGRTTARGHRVLWFSLEALGALVRSHRSDDSVDRAISRLVRSDLVVVDDIGMLPVGPDAAEGYGRCPSPQSWGHF
jgi:hypothetical protein